MANDDEHNPNGVLKRHHKIRMHAAYYSVVKTVLH